MRIQRKFAMHMITLAAPTQRLTEDPSAGVGNLAMTLVAMVGVGDE